MQACAILGKFEETRDSLNAYVVFRTEEQAQTVLKLDGTVWKEKHLRVDTAIPSPPASFKRTVFVGSLPFTVNDEEVWQLFSGKMENGDKDITSVRLVRDKVTNLGKVRGDAGRHACGAGRACCAGRVPVLRMCRAEPLTRTPSAPVCVLSVGVRASATSCCLTGLRSRLP